MVIQSFGLPFAPAAWDGRGGAGGAGGAATGVRLIAGGGVVTVWIWTGGDGT